ncbi:hypothetical protein H5410_013883 [Solanum commersonii]|uniref:AT hook motif-containing protein n=1 Tax=Solanum commersonii TaxID=4109 RepID=A0A9J5ZPM0_SOLCO|nr:hypothetical protein H5410_013883 [Solanum commersonii]
MNDQTKQQNPSAPTILPAKRRRGRPRKDEGPAKRVILQTPTTPAPEIMRQKDITTDESMLGQSVSGVIDGTFDAGYFLSVKLGNNATTLRGLIFEPGRFSPITAANDIAPQVKMHHRSQVITLQDQENGSTNEQLNVSPEQVLLPSDHPLVRNNQRASPDEMIKHKPQFTPLLENLRMVEQDEVMEVFEVANQSGFELNAEQGKCTNGQKSTQSQLIDSISIIQPGTLVCSDLNSSNDEIHHNNVVDGSQEMGSNQKQIEAEVENNKSNLETLVQPTELVHCELKKLEIHRAPPIDAKTQLIPTINPELQLNDLSQSGQGNQDFQPHQTPSFVELNFLAQETVAAESEVKPSDSIHSELHFVDMPQHNVTSDTQVMPQESISESVDFTMEMRNSPKEKQSTDVGTEVEFVGKEET